MTINVGGIRPKDPPSSPIAQGAADVNLVPETHVYDSEVPKLIIPGFTFADHRGSGGDVPQICCGAAIFAQTGLYFGKLDPLPRPSLPLTTCAIWLYL